VFSILHRTVPVQEKPAPDRSHPASGFTPAPANS